MILRPVSPQSPSGPPDDERPGRVDVDLALRRHPAMRQAGLDQRHQHALDCHLVQPGIVLRRHDDAGRTNRLAVDVAQRHLALGVRLQPGDGHVLVAAQLGDAAQDQMRVEDRRRHQRLRLRAGIAEHDALVAGALILVARAVHAHGDVRALGVQVHVDLGVLPGEAGLVIADVVDGKAGEMRQILGRDRFRPAHFARQNHAVRRHQRLARHARVRVGGKKGVQNGVADPVGDLVWMTFRHGLGGEEIFALVAHG